MKSLAKFTAAMALLPALSGAAPIINEADNYPVNFARCDYIVNAPENSKYIFSRDCKTVYILPPTVGNFKATPSLNDALLDNMCPLYSLNSRLTLQKGELQFKTQKRINELEALSNPSAKEIAELDRLNKLGERLSLEINRLTDPFRNVEGGKASFTIQASVPRTLVQEFYEYNQNLVYSNHVKFEPIPVSLGYLSVTNYQPSDAIKFPSVLAVYTNGVPADVSGKMGNTYKMTSSMAGQMILGVGKACTLYNRQQAALAKGQDISATDLGKELISELAPTFSYAYPVMSTISYSARIDVVRATEVLFNLDKSKTQFHVSEFATLLGRGAAGDAFNLDIDLGDLADRYTNPQDRQAFLAALTADIRERLAKKFLRELEAIELVKYTPDPNEKIPEPGYRDEPVGTVRRCSSSSFLGITYASSCHDELVTRKVPVAGTLEDTLKKVQNFRIDVSEVVKIRELVLHSENVVFQ